MTKTVFYTFMILSTLLFSCSKKVAADKYTLEEFNLLAHESTEIFGKGDDAINFADYASGVNQTESKVMRYKRLNFFAISFDQEQVAMSEAKRLKQYYARNWLFDRVEGEPVLEDYVIKTFHAINPNRQHQRVPKKEDAPEAHEAHH